MNDHKLNHPGDIVYLSRVPWDSLYQRPHHLAVGLARTWRVLFVDTPRSTFYRRLLKPLLARQPVRPFLWQAAPGLTVLSPAFAPFLPGWWPPPGQYALSRLFLHWAMRRLSISKPIVWAQDPRDSYFLDTLDASLLCYDCMDDYPLIAPSPEERPLLRAQEMGLLKRADVVFASSGSLAQRCAVANPRVTLVPNGVEPSRFSPLAAGPVAAGLAGILRPCIGYVGTLAPWLDFDLLAAIARARPQWSLVLVGPVIKGAETALSALRQLSNVHVPGEQPYASIPSYLRGFDVCLIPFCVNDLTRVVNPVKFYEYMAAGVPVVATPLPELAPFAAVCTLAADAGAFIAGIEQALADNSPARVQERLAVARANSWSQRVQTVVETLQAALRHD